MSDGKSVADLVPSGMPPGIPHQRIYATHAEDEYGRNPFETIGRKRNVACESANGEILATWDDDDYSAPNRLADQVARLQETGKAVTAYHTMKFTDGEKWFLYEGNKAIGIGTSLCFRREWWESHAFPEMKPAGAGPLLVGEDNGFVFQALQDRQFVSTSACGPDPKPGLESTDLMYATIHAGNTSKRDLNSYRELR